MAQTQHPEPARSQRVVHSSGEVGPFELAPLPYAESALEPVISRKTMSLHYGKHHKGYVDQLNSLVGGTDLANEPLEEVVMRTADDPVRTKIFNNAAQAWNHDFFWKCLKPGGSKPSKSLSRLIETHFGSTADMERQLGEAAISVFGSGWAWLALDAEKLRIVETSNADNPLLLGMKPLLTIDVWEHAYYVDYQNDRADFVHSLITKLLNYEFAEQNLGSGHSEGRDEKQA